MGWKKILLKFYYLNSCAPYIDPTKLVYCKENYLSFAFGEWTCCPDIVIAPFVRAAYHMLWFFYVLLYGGNFLVVFFWVRNNKNNNDNDDSVDVGFSLRSLTRSPSLFFLDWNLQQVDLASFVHSKQELKSQWTASNENFFISSPRSPLYEFCLAGAE